LLRTSKNSLRPSNMPSNIACTRRRARMIGQRAAGDAQPLAGRQTTRSFLGWHARRCSSVSAVAHARAWREGGAPSSRWDCSTPRCGFRTSPSSRTAARGAESRLQHRRPSPPKGGVVRPRRSLRGRVDLVVHGTMPTDADAPLGESFEGSRSLERLVVRSAPPTAG
jgi:hypothetical protein